MESREVPRKTTEKYVAFEPDLKMPRSFPVDN